MSITMSHKEILTAALALSENSRANLADQLLKSLDPSDQHEIDTLWAQEAESRIHAFEQGKMSAAPSEEVFAALRSRHSQ
jgi:putative addiction module component (TIGR02574 family)